MYNSTKNHKLTPISKVLRKNMTPEEKHLWYDFLKKLPITVHRQKVIDRYVVDFYIAEPKIVIELDEKGHLRPQNAEADRERDEYLASPGRGTGVDWDYVRKYIADYEGVISLEVKKIPGVPYDEFFADAFEAAKFVKS